MKANSKALKPRAKKAHARRAKKVESHGRAGREQASLSPFERLLVDISTRFIALPSDRVDSEILVAQKEVCESLGIDISALWQRDLDYRGSLTSTHIFVPPGFTLAPAEPMDAKETFPWSMKKLFEGETLIISRVADLPAAAARDLKLYRSFGIKSALTFPLSAGGAPVFGAVSFNQFRKERTWTTDTVNKLRLVAQVFANALARNRADRALQESEARYRGIFERSIEGIYRLSGEGRILFANPAAAKILGYDSAEDLVRSITDAGRQLWAFPDERARLVRQVEEGGTIREGEYLFKRKDGTPVWVSLKTNPVFGPDGRIAYSDGFIEDIDERKRSHEALKKSEHFLAETARIGKVGGWEFDIDTMKLMWTAEVYVIHEVNPTYEPTVEKGLAFFTPGSRPIIEQAVRQAIEQGAPYELELEIVTAKGHRRDVRTIGRMDLAHRRVYGFIQDISLRKENERDRVQLRQELAHLARVMAMSELSTSLAHEINQPLGAILNNAEAAQILLSQAQDKREALPEIVADIIHDAKRAGDVIRRVRSAVKKVDAQFEPLSVNGLINGALALIQNSLAVNGITLRLDLKPDIADIRGDRIRLQQVLLNLMMNALDGMKETPSRILTVRSVMDGPDTVTVSVIDSGPGIAEAGRGMVFKPFFTTKKEGLGLGLSICRSIIEEHGGRIWADNNPAGGATFSFSLKAWRDNPILD